MLFLLARQACALPKVEATLVMRSLAEEGAKHLLRKTLRLACG